METETRTTQVAIPKDSWRAASTLAAGRKITIGGLFALALHEFLKLPENKRKNLISEREMEADG